MTTECTNRLLLVVWTIFIYSLEPMGRGVGARQIQCYTVESMGCACQGGVWPGLSEPHPITIAASAAGRIELNILLADMTLRVHDFHPLPALGRHYRIMLHLHSIATVDGNGDSVRFPLRNFTQHLVPSAVYTLTLEKLELSYLVEDDLQAFTNLSHLELQNCNISGIGQRAFYSLATLAPGGASFQSNLRTVILSHDNKLTVFPWDVLYPLTGSLETVRLVLNAKLTELSYTSPDHDGLLATKFKGLRELGLWSNQLKTVPQTVLDTVSGKDVPEDGPLRIQFQGNNHSCSNPCELAPLVRWVRNGLDSSRRLDATCLDRRGEQNDMAHSRDFWLAYRVDNC